MKKKVLLLALACTMPLMTAYSCDQSKPEYTAGLFAKAATENNYGEMRRLLTDSCYAVLVNDLNKQGLMNVLNKTGSLKVGELQIYQNPNTGYAHAGLPITLIFCVEESGLIFKQWKVCCWP